MGQEYWLQLTRIEDTLKRMESHLERIANALEYATQNPQYGFFVTQRER